MAITLAKQNGSVVFVYGEQGRFLFSRSGELVGYTGDTVSVRPSGGNIVFVYDSTGLFLYSR